MYTRLPTDCHISTSLSSADTPTVRSDAIMRHSKSEPQFTLHDDDCTGGTYGYSDVSCYTDDCMKKSVSRNSSSGKKTFHLSYVSWGLPWIICTTSGRWYFVVWHITLHLSGHRPCAMRAVSYKLHCIFQQVKPNHIFCVSQVHRWVHQAHLAVLRELCLTRCLCCRGSLPRLAYKL